MSSTTTPHLFQRGWFWAGVVALACLIAGYQTFFSNPSAEKQEEFLTQRSIVPQPAVTSFPVAKGSDIGDKVDEDELVLGLTLNGEARAYPLARLNAVPKTKVLNDVLGGQAIVVIWCDKCETGVVYDRVVAERTLTFSVFGSLWRDSMVLEDQETKTQWSQWEGTAKLGELKGQTLRRLPCAVVSWQSWRTRHPKTEVVLLDKKQVAFRHDRFQDAPQFVLALGDGESAKAWHLAEIAKQGAINDHWRDRPVVAVFLENGGTARLFERFIGEKTLSFERVDGQLRDKDTGSIWDPLTGRAVAGPLRDAALTPLPSWVTSFSTWKLFHRQRL